MSLSKSKTMVIRPMVIRRNIAGIIGAGFLASAAVAPVATAGPLDPIVNGVLSTVGGCQSANAAAIKWCTEREILTNEVPIMLQLNPIGTKIVILGAGLFPDGKLRPVLNSRLETGLTLAKKFPVTQIITTGGNPKGGHTEAQAMRGWLVAHGVNPLRIITENASRTTVENANYTNGILARTGATGAVIVSSPIHVKRAMINFRTAVKGRIPIAGVTSIIN